MTLAPEKLLVVAAAMVVQISPTRSCFAIWLMKHAKWQCAVFSWAGSIDVFTVYLSSLTYAAAFRPSLLPHVLCCILIT